MKTGAGWRMMGIRPYLGTKEVAALLGINEKMIYSLVSEKGLPATKVTGKWLFSRVAVDRWVDAHLGSASRAETLILSGSHDILLEKALQLYNRRFPDMLGVYGVLGSSGGLRALARGLCHAATSHLLHEDGEDYNFAYAASELGDRMPAVVNFCRREQGLVVAAGNPDGIESVADLMRKHLVLANRTSGSGTRLLLDRELAEQGLSGESISGYGNEFGSHLDAALEVLAGRAHVTPAIRAAARILGLDFIPIRWERFDLLIMKERFFDEPIQRFLGLLREPGFLELANGFEGYELSLSGQTVFPQKNR